MDYSIMSPMDLSCHVHYKYSCTFTLESKLSNERLIKISHGKSKGFNGPAKVNVFKQW